MRSFVVTLLLFAALWPAPAHAEPSAHRVKQEATREASPPPDPQEPSVDEVVTSVRKQLLALVEQEGLRDLDDTHDDSATPDVAVGLPPDSMTSRAPETVHAPARGSKDLGWLEGMVLPDIPVRWDDRLVRTLEYYKTDARGRAHMRSLLARQGRYGDMIRKQLKAAGLPEDLSYVAMVESGYDPTAHSEVGAKGIWQFMTAPANEYELEMSRWVDQRMSPERSTEAATSYFRDLYGQLGSWPLAMAAFNMGYGALLRAMQKYNTNDFWVLSSLEAGLPYETIVYVNKIVACAIVGRNAQRFGFGDVAPEPPATTTTVAVPGGLQLARIARAVGIDADALAALNPELKKARIPPDVKTWQLHIPKDRLSRFKDKWPQFQPEAPTHRVHVLRLGERLSEVAELYGTSVSKLQALNDLEEGEQTHAGMKLLVPDVEPTIKAKADRPTVGIPGDLFLYVDRKRVFYRATEGDQLDEVARFFKITSDEIRMWNQISGDAKLHRGMYLQLFVPADADLSQAVVLSPDDVRTLVVGSDEFFDFHETQANRVRIRYRVKPGDTLRSLADRFDLSVGSIARINQFSRDKQLSPDSEIIVYAPEEGSKPGAAGL